MRRIGVTIIATAVLAAALAACNGASVNSSPDTAKVSVPASPARKAEAKTAPTKAPVARVGDTITVHGMDDGSKLAITLVKWVDPAKGDEYSEPESGKRFVAAQIRVTNTGTAAYDDTPSNAMQVADTQGQRFDSNISDVAAGPSTPSEVKLHTGDKAFGYVSFQVPKTSKVAGLQFTADSGFADEAGEWQLSRSLHAAWPMPENTNWPSFPTGIPC